MDIDGDVGVRSIDDLGPLVDAWTEPVIARSGQHDLSSLCLEVSCQELCDVEVELGFGVPTGGLGPGRVAILFGAAIEDLLIEEARVGVVQSVVSWVDADDLCREWVPGWKCPAVRWASRRRRRGRWRSGGGGPRYVGRGRRMRRRRSGVKGARGGAARREERRQGRDRTDTRRGRARDVRISMKVSGRGGSSDSSMTPPCRT